LKTKLDEVAKLVQRKDRVKGKKKGTCPERRKKGTKPKDGQNVEKERKETMLTSHQRVVGLFIVYNARV